MKSRYKDVILYSIIVILLALVVFLLLDRSYRHYTSWENRTDILQGTNPQIQTWMNVRQISRVLNISEDVVLQEMNISRNQVNVHITLDQFCKNYNQNCSDLVNRLNKLRI